MVGEERFSSPLPEKGQPKRSQERGRNGNCQGGGNTAGTYPHQGQRLENFLEKKKKKRSWGEGKSGTAQKELKKRGRAKKSWAAGGKQLIIRKLQATN